MGVNLTTPVTGSAQTGFTTPSFTITADLPPNAYSKQYAVTAAGGTGLSTVDAHAASSPFTITFSRPANVRSAPIANPVTGVIGNSPRNVYSIIVRKGEKPGTNQTPQVAVLRCDLAVVAGADVTEPDDVRAALSFLVGSLTQVSAGLGDTLINNVL
jgi:hypothetical protein